MLDSYKEVAMSETKKQLVIGLLETGAPKNRE